MAKNQAGISCYPDKAQYFSGEAVGLIIELQKTENVSEIIISISELDKEIYKDNIKSDAHLLNKMTYTIKEKLTTGNYGVDVWVKYSDSEVEIHTAFDIVDTITASIRYGFLTDFSKEEEQDLTDIEFAVKHHLNALQFYDWMYRHDKLVPEMEEYQEPLGRDTSLHTIRNKVKGCKERGIRPFAYGAVYAASKEAYEKHPDWAFYKMNQEPLLFADWLVFMDTTENSEWCRHIIGEYVKTVEKLGFMGIQMDTYGFPKHAWNVQQEKVSLAETFDAMIHNAKTAVQAIDDKAGVIFNAVNNWPTECIANSDQDVVYIEVWPPHVTYYHLYSLIKEAKYLGGKNVILAAYIEAFRDAKSTEEIQAAEYSYLFTNAVIQASGGTQIVLGETNGLLQDSYFVNYTTLREEFLPIVKSYCDFSVRYGKLLFDQKAMDISLTAVNGINTDIMLSVRSHDDIQFSSCAEAGKIWSVIREAEHFLTIQLINLQDVNEFWNQPKYQKPGKIIGIQADVLIDAEIKGVYAVTPDDLKGMPVPLKYEVIQKENGQHIVLQAPELELWTLIWIELK
jgi:dextranase